jgi:hypothetical protein
MQSFDSLQELHFYLEKNALNLKDLQIADLFKELKDLKFTENKIEEAKKARLEQMLFDFNVMYGKNALFSNEDNEIINIFNLIEHNEYNYLEHRLNYTENPLLQSHYAKILWFSPKSEFKYGVKLVFSNLELFNLYKKNLIENKDDNYSLKTFNSLKNAYSISYKLNSREKDFIKSEILAAIKEHDFFDDSTLGIFLINWIWEDRKKFTKEDFNGIDIVCWQLAEKLANKGDLHSSIEILEHGAKIEQKLQTKNFEWVKEIASAYEKLVEEYEKDNNLLMALKYCPLAIDKYNNINDIRKVNELETKYIAINRSAEYAKFSVEIDNDKFIKIIEKNVDNVLKYTPNEIILFLMTSKSLFPKYSDLNIITEENFKEAPILSECSKMIIDQNGHPTKYIKTIKENKSFNLDLNYKEHLEIYYNHLVSDIFINAILKKKFSAEILINYLKNNSWIGKDQDIPHGSKIKYNWLSNISPSISDYFRQIEIYIVNPNSANFILCIDSLVLKIEGIIRDLCEFNEIITSKSDRNNKLTRKEKDINELLREDKLEDILGKDDLLFLKMLLIEKSGYNLRNNIAHALIKSNNYTIYNASLILLAVLRLSRFDMKDKKS